MAMKTQPVLGLDDVKAIAEAAEAEALKNQWAVTIAIVDAGGHLLWLQRLDGAAPVSAAIAPAKARTAAQGRREPKGYEDMINGGRPSFQSAPMRAGAGGRALRGRRRRERRQEQRGRAGRPRRHRRAGRLRGGALRLVGRAAGLYSGGLPAPTPARSKLRCRFPSIPAEDPVHPRRAPGR
ncbi:MAG: hypothetical protein RLZZ341_833 [Pseudomonadota bacterium]